MLSFKQHALNTKAKVNTRNNLLRKLTNSRWGAHLATVRTTALALRFSTAEYACSSWGRSRNTGHVDIALNDTCRIITGCLKATPIPCLYALVGIADSQSCQEQGSTNREAMCKRVLDTAQLGYTDSRHNRKHQGNV